MTKTLREKIITQGIENPLTEAAKIEICEFIEKEFKYKANGDNLEKFFIYERNIFNYTKMDYCEIVKKQLKAFLESEGFEAITIKENGSRAYCLSLEF
ncbi:hypothetical protein POQMFEI_00059 [Enterococcus phage vB_OCPT_CCS2]|nr:hypothetical protein POQMFEI_00059 [Enterococcus phage vB_OCPT_CCS2]WDS60684.1 hypothetical protein [Enterococcus phage vB_EfKS5]